MRIIVFGDSISEGFWDYENGGWVNLLKLDLWKKYGYDKMLMNYGISSYTSNNVLKVFKSFFDGCSRRETGKEKDSIVIIAIGINDCSIGVNDNNPRVDSIQFTKNINDIVNKCRDDELISKMIFIGNINIDEEVINNDVDGDFLFYNSEIEKYNNIIKDICNKNNLEYIELFGLMNNDDLDDGLHPNTKGHIKIFEKIKSYFDK